jgi:hypothetical protein
VPQSTLSDFPVESSLFGFAPQSKLSRMTHAAGKGSALVAGLKVGEWSWPSVVVGGGRDLLAGLLSGLPTPYVGIKG